MSKPKLSELTIDYKQKLADEHAEFIHGLLLRELEDKMSLYRAAFVHGYKHGKEE